MRDKPALVAEWSSVCQIQVDILYVAGLNPTWGMDKFIWTNLSNKIDNSSPAIIVISISLSWLFLKFEVQNPLLWGLVER